MKTIVLSLQILEATYKRLIQVASKFLKESVSEHMFAVGSSEGGLYNICVGLVPAKIGNSPLDSIGFFLGGVL